MTLAVATGLDPISLATGPAAVRDLLARAPLGAVEIPRPPLDDLPYCDFVRAVLRAQGFKLDFNAMDPAAALALVADQLLGRGAFADQVAALAEDITELADFASALVGARASVSLRTYFAPGDLVWHVDRVSEASAFRLLWPLGRPAGMRVTPADNVDRNLHRAYMHREHPLLCQLDTRVLRGGGDVETLWAHRPVQVEAMVSGEFPFLLDRSGVHAVTPGAISIHRVETPAQPGTYHCASWANRASPGLQVVITAASDPA